MKPKHDDGHPQSQHDGHDMQGMDMSGKQMSGNDMMRQRFERELWTTFASIIFGVWLATSPLVADYRDTLQSWNDIVVGVAIAVLGLISITYKHGWARWANTILGIWLLFAPLVFWSPTALAYTTETLIGALVIACAILIPGMPGMNMQPGPDAPLGWSYNPSTWQQRAPVIALALFSFFISRYLAAYQLGYINHAWDPVFGGGTQRVLNSDVSKAWPISDAGFGALAYMLEALSGFMGNRQRWRTMPWMVLMFGVLVVPLGVTSIILVVLQPVMVGTWCALCLVTALAMVLMIPLAVDEVVAMFQFMGGVRHTDQPFWSTFWRGGTVEGHDNEPPRHATNFHSPLLEIATAAVRGVSLSWSLLVSAVIGLWLMGAPVALGADGWAANSDFLFGPLVVVVAICALAEVIRPLRYLNILFALWIIVAPWLLGGATTASVLNDTLLGLLLIALSLPRGPIREHYGAWTRRVRGTLGRGERAPA